MGYYAEQGNNVAGTLQSDFAKLATVAATGSHLANQKQANIESAANRVDIAKNTQKLGQFEEAQQNLATEKYQKEYEEAAKAFSDKEEEIKGFDETMKSQQAVMDDARANYEKTTSNKKKGEYQQAFDTAQKSFKETQFSKEKAEEALDNLKKNVTGAEYVYNQAKIQKAKLEYQSKLNAENVAKAEARYKKVGGK